MPVLLLNQRRCKPVLILAWELITLRNHTSPPAFCSSPTILAENQWVQGQREENTDFWMAVLREIPSFLPDLADGRVLVLLRPGIRTHRPAAFQAEDKSCTGTFGCSGSKALKANLWGPRVIHGKVRFLWTNKALQTVSSVWGGLTNTAQRTCEQVKNIICQSEGIIINHLVPPFIVPGIKLHRF